MKNNSFEDNSFAITVLSNEILETGIDPKQHPKWKEFIKLLDHTNEISRLYYFKQVDKGKDYYYYHLAFIGNEIKEEERLRVRGHRPFEVVDIKTNPGWTVDDFQELYKISMIDDIARLALKIFNRIENPCFLSGPISANDKCPSFEENSKRFYKTIWKLQRSGHNMFDQTPFIEKINIILEQVNDKKRKRVLDKVLERVFYPLIESERIVRHLRLDTWRTSHGAQWEVVVGNYHAIPSYELKPTFSSLSVKDAHFYLMNLKSCNEVTSAKAS